jgi:type II secretory pathway component PulK
LVALIIVILITVMAMTFLEKIIRLSKTTGGIENSAQAYTLATGLIEEQLIDPNMTKKQPWNILNKTE